MPLPEYLKFDVYQTEIKYANVGEPNVMYWWVYKQKDTYIWIHNSREISDFSDLLWNSSNVLPIDLNSLKPFKNTKIRTSQLTFTQVTRK